MTDSAKPFPSDHVPDTAAIEQRFNSSLRQLRGRTDGFMAKLLLGQWIALIGLALIVSPRTWQGRSDAVHIHVWAAIFLGGAISLYPAWLGWKRPGETVTRHLLVVAQMLLSSLLIDITGGRLESHFHIFGSLAILAFYRDVRVFVTATIVVYLDHVIRGIFWPESVFGVLAATGWRALEHAGWVLFEVVFLTVAARLSLKEMREIVTRQIGLEQINRGKEQEVRDRTRELAQSEEQFRTFFHDSPIGLYRATSEGEFLMVNPALLKILGYATLEELRAPRRSAPPLETNSARREFLAQLAVTEDVLHRDTVWRRRDGSPLQIRESGRAFRDATGRIVHIDGTVDDITQHRQLEERYQQAQKVQAIGQLAGGVAHDFNNVLTVITGYSQMLLMETGLNDTVRRDLGLIHDASKRAAALTAQLLAFSRKQRLQPRVIHLDAITADMHTLLKRLVGESIGIRALGTPGLAAVKADPGQIQQVIMNMVVNARDAMPGGGQVTIETANVTLSVEYARSHLDVIPGRYVMLAVSDSGSGMTPEVQARLFEPFFTTKEVGYGTGLGLATCHGIIKQSGGYISVYSEVGHGSTFKVFLPRVDEQPVVEEAEVPAGEKRGSGEQILLVEDDHSVREFGCEVLRSLGYRVTAAANGVEALARFKEDPSVALLFTDVIMPTMGGRKLFEHIRGVSPELPVLFTSGYTFDALGSTDELEAGCAFVAKPYSPEQLGRKVHECLQAATGAGVAAKG